MVCISSVVIETQTTKSSEGLMKHNKERSSSVSSKVGEVQV